MEPTQEMAEWITVVTTLLSLFERRLTVIENYVENESVPFVLSDSAHSWMVKHADT